MPEAVCLKPQPLNTCGFGTINDFNVFRKAYNFDVEFVKFTIHEAPHYWGRNTCIQVEHAKQFMLLNV